MTTYAFENIAIVSTEKKKPTEEDRFSYIGLEHLSPDTFEVATYGSEVAPKGDKLVMKKGDVLFGKRRAYQKKVGIAPCDGIFSAHGMVLRPNTEVVDARFFPFFIKSDCFLDEAIRVSVGSLSPTVNWRDLKVLEFDLPSLEKQAELAEILWAAEGLKTKYRNLLVNNDDLVKSRFIEMFGEPTAGKPKYPQRSLSEFAKISSGATPSRKHAEYYGGSIPWVKTGEVAAGNVYSTEENITQEGLSNSACHLIPAGSLLVAMYGQGGTRGKAAQLMIDAATNQACAAIEPDESVDNLFMLQQLHLCYEDFRRLSKGGNQKNLSQQILKEYRFIVPPIEQQMEYASFVKQVDKSGFSLFPLLLSARWFPELTSGSHLVPFQEKSFDATRRNGRASVPLGVKQRLGRN